jgi:hypothetical protein
MQKMVGLAVAAVILIAAAPAGAATVTVQVEGTAKVLGPVAVQTPASVTKGGHTCPGTTPIGALEAATNGDWSGPWGDFGQGGDFAPETVLGESHTFDSGGYWSVYVNNTYQNAGTCHVSLADGDEVLVFASDDPYTSGVGGYQDNVILDAPAAIRPGEPFEVRVRQTALSFDGAGTGTTSVADAAGATVTAGAASATTGPGGKATLTVADRGPVTLVATKGNYAPDRTARCVTDGADVSCGTTTPGAPAPPVAPAAPCLTSGDDGFCGSPDRRAAFGQILGIKEQQRFPRGRGPRQLAGRVATEPSGIADVRLRLTRNAPGPGRCSTLDGRRERLVKMRRCGAKHGRWFSVGALERFRYLLPHRLGPGRYVLDVMVVDKAGNRALELARGRNRVVFHVAR